MHQNITQILLFFPFSTRYYDYYWHIDSLIYSFQRRNVSVFFGQNCEIPAIVNRVGLFRVQNGHTIYQSYVKIQSVKKV